MASENKGKAVKVAARRGRISTKPAPGSLDSVLTRVSVSELRSAARARRAVKVGGRTVAFLVSPADFGVLEEIEDRADVASIRARSDEPVVSFEEVCRKLGFS